MFLLNAALMVFRLVITAPSIDETISTTLGRIQEGVTRPLKVRVEQVLIAEPGVLVLYKLTNLLKFYHQTIR